ncbi:MAG: hypothetical protein ACI9FB_001587 [Candidatus Azotimanducaceae bacterium]|jgi:hypothetical protein
MNVWNVAYNYLFYNDLFRPNQLKALTFGPVFWFSFALVCRYLTTVGDLEHRCDTL